MDVEKRHPTEEEWFEIIAWRGDEKMPKRLKMQERAWGHMEHKRMVIEDRESDLRGKLERKPAVVEVEKIVYQEQIVVEERIVYVEKDAAASTPAFAGGQAVHQFWAGWMEGATKSLTGIKGAARPAWFSSLVFAATSLSPSMPRCRNDRDFTRHQLSRSLSFRHLGMLGDRNVPR